MAVRQEHSGARRGADGEQALVESVARAVETGRDPVVCPLRVLHVIITLGETNSQYNEHCLPLVGARDLSIATYFAPRLTAPEQIQVFAGDGTLRGFFGALREALAAKAYDVVHVHAPETGALVVAALAARVGRGGIRRSLVYTVHDSFHDYDLRDKTLMLAVFAVFRRVVFCGNAAYESYPALWARLAGRRARVVQNAADLDRVEAAIAGVPRARESSAFEVVSVGRLEKVKDPLTLLAALREVGGEDVRLTLIGAGPLDVELGRRMRAARLEERVELTGLIPRDQVFVRFARADLFVSPSRGEGLPVAVLEAMAAACPVVLSDIPPHREVADGADFVPLVPPGDPRGFAREIERFRDMPEDARAEIGLRCRDLVRERFALPRMHAGYDEVYRELM